MYLSITVEFTFYNFLKSKFQARGIPSVAFQSSAVTKEAVPRLNTNPPFIVILPYQSSSICSVWVTRGEAQPVDSSLRRVRLPNPSTQWMAPSANDTADSSPLSTTDTTDNNLQVRFLTCSLQPWHFFSYKQFFTHCFCLIPEKCFWFRERTKIL